MTDLSQLISHVRDREYMSGIERDQIRVKATSEVFTPTQQVQNSLVRNSLWAEAANTITLLESQLLTQTRELSPFQQFVGMRTRSILTLAQKLVKSSSMHTMKTHTKLNLLIMAHQKYGWIS